MPIWKENRRKPADFQADLSNITLTLEEMKPHSNPRYGRDEIGIGNAFADFFFPLPDITVTVGYGMSMTGGYGGRMREV